MIVFTQNDCNTFDDFSLIANDGTIGAKNVVKYLDILINSQLTWEYHTQFVVDKVCIAKAKGVLSKLDFRSITLF